MATNPYSQYGSTPMYIPSVNPYVAQPVSQPMIQRQPDMIWVQGEAGMKAYQMAPSTRAILWDQDNPVIYIKTADANGMVSVKTLDYTERGADGNKIVTATEPNADFATKEDIEALKDSLQRQINRLNSQINNMRNKDKKETCYG